MSGAVDGPVRVLYFAGSGRSGTTVMNSILGQVEGVFAAGELRYLWHRGVVRDHRCGCGLPFSGCPVWTGVMKDLGMAHPRLDAQGIGDRLLRRLRIARVPLILGRRALGRPPVPPHPDDAAIAALYRSIATRTDATVIVDSSKLPPYGLLVSGLPDVELYVLHVVRDPRATAFSWRRQKKTLDTGEDGALMARLPIWKSSALWLLWNSLTAMWWRGRADRYLQVRYEEFADRPRRPWRTSRSCSASTRRTSRSSPRPPCACRPPTRWPATPIGTPVDCCRSVPTPSGGLRCPRESVGSSRRSPPSACAASATACARRTRDDHSTTPGGDTAVGTDPQPRWTIHREENVPMLALVTGTGRSGTTLVQETLSRHPRTGFISGLDDKLPRLNMTGALNGRLYRRMSQRSSGMRALSESRTLLERGRLRVAPSEAYGLIDRHVMAGFSKPCRDLVAEDLTPYLRQRLTHFFEARIDSQGCDVFIQHLTGWPRTGFMREAFPDLKDRKSVV